MNIDFLKIIGFNVTLYVVAYLAVCFVNWEFCNPIQWILDIPNKEDYQRFFLMVIITCYVWFWVAVYSKTKNS